MSAVTRFVLRHKALVVLAWLAVAAAGVLTVSGTTHRMANSFSLPGPAARTDAAIAARYGNGGNQAPLLPVVSVPAGSSVGDPAIAAEAGRVLAAAAAAVPDARLADYADTGDRVFVTAGGRSTWGMVFVRPDTSFGSSTVGPAVSRALAAAAPAGWKVGLTGSDLLAQGPTSSRGTGVLAESMIGGLGALAILVVVFASFLALLPVLIGAVSVLGTFLLVGGLTEVTTVSQIVEFLIALIGLGVAIDYSLLVVSRWREERARGLGGEEAVVEAMAHAGRSVVFSGVTVAIGLLSMIVLPVPMLRSVGLGGMLVPLVSVAVALTLLPAVLAGVGARLDWPRVRTERSASRVFSAWAAGVYRRKWLSAVAGVAILAVLVIPALSLRLGEPGSSAEAPSGPAHDALVTLTSGGVPDGVITPVEVLVHDTPATLTSTVAAARSVPGVAGAVAPGGPAWRRDGTAIVDVLTRAEGTLPAGQTATRRVEAALAPTPGVIGVGGTAASLIDFDADVYGNFPLMLGLIGVATFLLLARAFRSVVLAAKAVACNLISLAAAYGVLTWIWQDGHGSHLLWGLPATGAITMWVPLMVFAFLFGLSMDYEVFILTRIREAYDRTGDGRAAVVEGLGRTGRLVTSAAAILMLSFLSMSTAPATDIKVLATGLGAGILVDAVVVRCLLVPALAALFGPANWWVPGWAVRGWPRRAALAVTGGRSSGAGRGSRVQTRPGTPLRSETGASRG